MEKQLRLSDNVEKLHQMFGKRLYSDKYAWISEICQNAVDSHRMAGVTEPVKIGIGYNTMEYFYVLDTGLSFTDQDDFVKKVCTILESGKTENKTNDENCAMGMHGIGSISVSAYQPSWMYTVVTPTGEKFVAILKEVEGKGLTYDIKSLGKTDQSKSVLFQVSVEPGRTRELIIKMKEKLAYFKDILFEFHDSLLKSFSELITINSTFNIIQTPDVQISTLSSCKEMHIALDQYTYPIVWTRLNIPSISMNVGLKFGMADGLEPDITRENIKNCDDYSNIVLGKLRSFSTWCVKKFNDSVPDEFTNIQDMYNALSAPKQIRIGALLYDISVISRFSSVPFKIPKFKDVDTNIFNAFITSTGKGRYLFQPKYFITQNGAKVQREYDNNFNSYAEGILLDATPSVKVLKYIKSEFRQKHMYVKKPIKLMVKPNILSYQQMMNLNATTLKKTYRTTGVNSWREPIRQFKILEKAYVDQQMICVSKIVVPEGFIKKAVALPKRKLVGQIPIGYAKDTEKFSSQYSCKFVEKLVNVDALYKIPNFHVYGTESQRSKLNLLFNVQRTYKNTLRVCTIKQSYQQLLKGLNLHNFMDIEEFLKGKHVMFRRMMTSYLISQELLTEYREIFINKEIIRTYISTDVAANMDKLQVYCRQYNFGDTIRDPDQLNALVALTHELKLYDLEMWTMHKQMLRIIGKFSYINILAGHMTPYSGYKVLATDILTDVTKYRKIKMDIEHYKSKK